ncbi:hypothetical protein Tco_1025958, partial [Tanacetum coccineum]
MEGASDCLSEPSLGASNRSLFSKPISGVYVNLLLLYLRVGSQGDST